MRSSPTLSGRCWLGIGTPACPRHQRLRSSPTLSGRCWSPCTGCKGRRSRSCDPHRPSRAGAGLERNPRMPAPPEVAILTDPLGPVLGPVVQLQVRPASATLRSSPTLSGRCWRPSPGWPTARGNSVAILTDPLGPVLGDDPVPRAAECVLVAILTDPLGPVLGRHRRGVRAAGGSCDPHRPSRAGAGSWIPRRSQRAPTSCDPHRPSRAGAGALEQGLCRICGVDPLFAVDVCPFSRHSRLGASGVLRVYRRFLEG